MSVREGYKQTEIGVIPMGWDAIPLKTYSQLLMSNVDKKTSEDETPVALCNYMDVYRNNYITTNINFMRATASELQIKNFTLQIGDIMITKDSETKSDIARASVVIEQLENVLCGYHLALVKPNPAKFDSIFLTKLFDLTNIRKQLINKANGTTRFGLNVATIENLMIPLPPLPEQQKIAEILSTVDQKIDSINSKIKETQTLKQGLMQRLLSDGIGHSEFKESEIGRIPTGWEVVELKKIGQIVTGSTPKTSNQEYYTNGTRLWASPSDLGKSKEVKNTANKLTDLGFEQTRILPARSILVTCIGSTIGKIGMAYEEMSTNQQINSLVCTKENSPDFYYYVLDMKKEYIKNLAGTQAVPLLNKSDFSVIKVPLPPLEEQKQIAEILSTSDEKLEILRAKKEAFETLKKGLMQKLLSGEVRV